MREFKDLRTNITEISNDYAELLDLLYKAEYALVDIYPEEDMNRLKAAAKHLYDKAIDLAIEQGSISLDYVTNESDIKIPSFMLDNKRSS
jgi:hypothetical protein